MTKEEWEYNRELNSIVSDYRSCLDIIKTSSDKPTAFTATYYQSKLDKHELVLKELERKLFESNVKE